MTNGAAKGSLLQSRRTRLFAVLALIPALCAVLLATAGPITSGDLWWHVRTGAWILEHGQLPSTDPFSHTAGDTHWVLQEYGSQVIFALVHKLGGFTGLKLLAVLLGLSTLSVVYMRSRSQVRLTWSIAMTALFALLFALKWELRPQLFSILFFFWLERCLFPRGIPKGASPTLRRCLELGLLSMLWVQLHAEALFTPLLTIAITCGAVAAALRSKASPRHVLMWLAMTASALVGTLASPLLAQPHIYALVGRGVPQQYIEEWFRPWVLPGDPRFAPVTLAVFAAFAIALVIGSLFCVSQLKERLSPEPKRNTISWERLAFFAGCLLFAFSARRFFWLTWFPLLECLVFCFRWRPSLRGARLVPASIAAICGLALFGSHYPASAVASIQHGRATEVVDPTLFPRFAAEFTRDAGIEGKLFHPYEWGGYLGFVTGQPVFIDGRTVLFEKVIQERWLAEHDPVQRQQIFKARDVEVIVFNTFKEAGDGPWTPGGGKWISVWRDNLAVVWVKRGSENERRARSWWAQQGIELDAKDGITIADVNLAHPDWLQERYLLPAAIIDKLPTAAGQTADELLLARLQVWQSARMQKNIRAELRAAVKRSADSDSTSAWHQHLASLLEADDLGGFIKSVTSRLNGAPAN